MTTTELIKLLKKYELGGATGRPREVMFQIGDEIVETGNIEVVGAGDGLVTELFLSLPSLERKKGKWSIKNGELAFWDVCSECGRMVMHKAPFYNFCPNCGADMRMKQEEKEYVR